MLDHDFQCMVLTILQAAAYGKCVVADYNAVYKDKCVKEFMRLKDCYLVSLHKENIEHTCINTVKVASKK